MAAKRFDYTIHYNVFGYLIIDGGTVTKWYVESNGLDKASYNIYTFILYDYADSNFTNPCTVFPLVSNDETPGVMTLYPDIADSDYVTNGKLHFNTGANDIKYLSVNCVEWDDDDPRNQVASWRAKITATFNTPPSTPSSITVPSSILQGNSINVSWGASSDTDGNLSGYKLERQINGGTWTQVYSGPNRSFSEVTQSSWNTVYYRVSAYDSAGAYSGVKLSNAITVTHNTPPVISGSDTDLGTFGLTKPNAYSYTISDAQNDAVTVTEKFDGNVWRTYTPTLGQSYNFDCNDTEWMQVLNGNHTMEIIASDGQDSTTRTLTFTKKVDKIQFYLNPCLVASNMPSKAQESIIAELPTGSTCKVEITNNANDANPTWQDITDKVLNDKKIMITNTIKTAANWGYNIRVTIDRGTATGPVWISGGSGFFE